MTQIAQTRAWTAIVFALMSLIGSMPAQADDPISMIVGSFKAVQIIHDLSHPEQTAEGLIEIEREAAEKRAEEWRKSFDSMQAKLQELSGELKATESRLFKRIEQVQEDEFVTAYANTAKRLRDPIGLAITADPTNLPIPLGEVQNTTYLEARGQYIGLIGSAEGAMAESG